MLDYVLSALAMRRNPHEHSMAEFRNPKVERK